MFTNANQLRIRLHTFSQIRARPLLSAVLVAIVLCDPQRAIAQTAAAESPGSMQFEVVSIKPSKLTKGGIIQVLPNGFEATGYPLGATLLMAYFPPPFYKHGEQLRGYPKWLFEDIYDIEARVSPADAARWQALNQDVFTYKSATVLQGMLRAVLAERCLLRVHTEESKGVGYALTIANLKKPSIMVDKSESHPSQVDVVGKAGFRAHSVEDGYDVQTFYQTSMPAFAEWLNLTANYPIVDRTGLTEKYHFSIRHTSPDSPGDLEPIVPYKLDEIGIKLVKEEITLKTLYVDQIQRPSPN